MPFKTCSSDNRFSVTYRIIADNPHFARTRASEIALEQSVELPANSIPKKVNQQGIPGRVESIKQCPGMKKLFDATISFRSDLTAFSIPQFMNVLFGNSSLYRGIRIIKLDLPDILLDAFGGPRFGIQGIRKAIRVFDRPLACTAIKPVGLSIHELAKRAHAFASGGIDIIKEDHGFSNQPYHPFKKRVSECQAAVEKANAGTGLSSIYCPMVSGGFDEIEEQISFVKKLGIKGVLMAPLLSGWDTVRVLARKYGLIFLGHPALSGAFIRNPAHGMTPAVLLGTIYRLIGADASIFVNEGGRFGFSRQDCFDLADALRSPLGSLKPSFPCPAGGMTTDRISSLKKLYRKDTIFLIAGALLQGSVDLQSKSAAFMDKIIG